MRIWPFDHIVKGVFQPDIKALAFLTLAACAFTTLPAYSQNTENSDPIPLVSNQSEIEEQGLTILRLPPPSPKEGSGVDEATIFHYFDSENAVTPAAKHLPKETKKTLDAISDHWSKNQRRHAPITLKRGSFADISIDATQKNSTDAKDTKADENKLDISISESAQKRQVTVGDLQEQAYNALMVGQVEVAISLYKQSLKLSPNNRLSMFGLATTYHRNGQLTQARNLYSDLLTQYPDDRDTLNNFLVLISDSAPQDALTELYRLEYHNPDFSPIAAQIGMLHQRFGNNQKAIEYLKKAINLSPENLSYRYNLAVLFDRLGKYQEAIILYRQVLDAAKTGAPIPGDKKDIYDRLVYITTER